MQHQKSWLSDIIAFIFIEKPVLLKNWLFWYCFCKFQLKLNCLMRNFYMLLFSILTCSSFNAMTNNFNDSEPYERQDSEHIKEIMTSWSELEGEWLYESMAALVMNTEQPIRPARVSSTTFELLQKMDDYRVQRIERVAQTELANERNAARSISDSYYWSKWIALLRSADCDMNRGRSNGDPHFLSFDGESYDFQTAGDYLLTSSINQNFLIQTQQVRHNENISVNGAVFMNVYGDKVEIYGQNKPEGMGENAILINGVTLENENADIFLRNGGVIRKQNKRWVISWPTGEQLHVSQRSFSDNAILDLTVFVPSCNDSYIGLLGNNNGSRNDDLDARDPETNERLSRADFLLTYDQIYGNQRSDDNVRSQQKDDLNYISRTFGDQYMLDSMTSLFTNPLVGISDEIRYPSTHLTLADAEDDEIDEAIAVAREAGVREEDIFAAVYDYTFVGLLPIVEQPTYVRPEVRQESENPKLDKNKNPERRDNDGNIIPQVRFGIGVINGVPIPNRPRTQPRPTNNSGGGRTGR
jgi:hypothetical protein